MSSGLKSRLQLGNMTFGVKGIYFGSLLKSFLLETIFLIVRGNVFIQEKVINL